MPETALKSVVCKSFAVWDIEYKYSWLELIYSHNSDPTIYDDNLTSKPTRGYISISSGR